MTKEKRKLLKIVKARIKAGEDTMYYATRARGFAKTNLLLNYTIDLMVWKELYVALKFSENIPNMETLYDEFQTRHSQIWRSITKND